MAQPGNARPEKGEAHPCKRNMWVSLFNTGAKNSTDDLNGRS